MILILKTKMKSFTIMVICLLGTLGLKAQTNVYHPIIKFPAWWSTFTSYNNSNVCGSYDFDSLVKNGIKYRWLGNSCFGEHMLLREDTINKKVYAAVYDYNGTAADTNEYMLYDFNINIGDSVQIRQWNFYTKNFITRLLHCTNQDSVLSYDGYRKRWRMEFYEKPYWANDTAKNWDYWVEGVGSMLDLFYAVGPWYIFEKWELACHGRTTGLDQFMAVYGDGCSEILATQNDIIKPAILSIFPNPINENNGFKVKCDCKIERTLIYNLLGDICYEEKFNDSQLNEINLKPNLNKGIYFITVQYNDRSVITQKLVVN